MPDSINLLKQGDFRNFRGLGLQPPLCTDGDRPVLKRCNPGACPNSIVTLEHKPHWERVKQECEVLMGHRTEAEPYQKALRNIHAVSNSILRSLE